LRSWGGRASSRVPDCQNHAATTPRNVAVNGEAIFVARRSGLLAAKKASRHEATAEIDQRVKLYVTPLVDIRA